MPPLLRGGGSQRETEGFSDSLVGGVKDLVFDMAALEFLSSAGLRVLLQAHKTMTKQGGTMVVKNLIPDVLKVLDVTGFSRILTIEK